MSAMGMNRAAFRSCLPVLAAVLVTPLAGHPAAAQSIPSLGTVSVWSSNVPTAMATVTDDGSVTIDWKQVERAAASDGSCAPHPMVLCIRDATTPAIAKIMIAIRDHTYKEAP